MINDHIPEIFIINLERSPVRKKWMESQLMGKNIRVNWIKAVDGNCLSPDSTKLYNARKSFLKYGRELHANEIGCYLSHVNAWKEIQTRKIKEAIILEDDITIYKDFWKLIQMKSSWMLPDSDIIYFAHHVFQPILKKTIKELPQYSLCRFKGVVNSTGAYYINLFAVNRY